MSFEITLTRRWDVACVRAHVHRLVHRFFLHRGAFELGTCLLFDRLVPGMSVFTACTEQGVTVSHAYCPCASSSNLLIAPHHALCVLHKMCISRTELPPAHVERTCRLA